MNSLDIIKKKKLKNKKLWKKIFKNEKIHVDFCPDCSSILDLPGYI